MSNRGYYQTGCTEMEQGRQNAPCFKPDKSFENKDSVIFKRPGAQKKVLSGPDQNSNKSDSEVKETLTITLSSVICIHEHTLKQK